jgi:hypothetical protein
MQTEETPTQDEQEWPGLSLDRSLELAALTLASLEEGPTGIAAYYSARYS